MSPAPSPAIVWPIWLLLAIVAVVLVLNLAEGRATSGRQSPAVTTSQPPAAVEATALS
jgi:hypothetical protein